MAARQLEAGSSEVVLLGRTVDLAGLEAALGAAWRRAGRATPAPALCVVKCDSSAASDVAGLASSSTAFSSILHAAGVLRVRLP